MFLSLGLQRNMQRKQVCFTNAKKPVQPKDAFILYPVHLLSSKTATPLS